MTRPAPSWNLYGGQPGLRLVSNKILETRDRSIVTWCQTPRPPRPPASPCSALSSIRRKYERKTRDKYVTWSPATASRRHRAGLLITVTSSPASSNTGTFTLGGDVVKNDEILT